MCFLLQVTFREIQFMGYWPFGKKVLSFGAEAGSSSEAAWCGYSYGLAAATTHCPLHKPAFGLFYQIWKRLTVIKERSCEHALIL